MFEALTGGKKVEELWTEYRKEFGLDSVDAQSTSAKEDSSK